jgi:predicted RND superfamily exporter protein
MILAAFVQAGAYALISIALLLWIALRRASYVLLTLIPLALAGLVTMEIMALIGMQFNFANIIALPLLLGVGVSRSITSWLGARASRAFFRRRSLAPSSTAP